MMLAARGYALALGVFALTQLTKWLMIGPLALRQVQQIVILPIFNFTYMENSGVSLGMFTANTDTQRWLLVGVTAIIAAGVAAWISREKNRWDVIALGLVLGGALGNIFDRARYGYVLDYLDLHFGQWRPFLIFNLEDVAITCGVVLLLVRSLLLRDKPAQIPAPSSSRGAASETLH